MADIDDSGAIGSLLRVHRQRLDLTIERLSEASGLGVRTISDIERGISTGPQPRTVAALADALCLTAEERSDFSAAARAGRVGAARSDASLISRPNRAVDFSGRAHERAILATMLVSTPDRAGPVSAIVVSGPPGVGKTTLALECLHNTPYDRILFMDLQGLQVAALHPPQILQSLLRQISGGKAVCRGEPCWRWRAWPYSRPPCTRHPARAW